MKLYTGPILIIVEEPWPSGKNDCLWSCRLVSDSKSFKAVTVKLVFAASLFDVQH